jgi:hypothetical protein
MFSFLRTKASRESNTVSEAKTGRRGSRRAALQVEGLEGRQLLNARFGVHHLITGGATGGYTGTNSGYFSHFGTGQYWQAKLIHQGDPVTLSNQGGTQHTNPTFVPGTQQTSSGTFSGYATGSFWQERNSLHSGSVTLGKPGGSGTTFTFEPGYRL